MSRTFKGLLLRHLLCGVGGELLLGCGAGPRPAAPPACDQVCQDGVALRGARSMMKLAYNTLVMGRPVGPQDKETKCLPRNGTSGSVRVFGDATANAIQGDSFVSLSYDFKDCSYAAPPDPTADQNYSVTLTGLVTENGTLSVQPTSTTALLIESDSLSVSGTVYDPPLDYTATACALALNQNGTGVAGTLCGRNAGFTF
ncbi:MAG: hypothetical protein ABJB12_18300 [Pseudomonadota bacterium]